MLYAMILLVHVTVCFVLIAVILLQAGRGGGLADTFGGAAQSFFGTRGAAILTRATTVCAVIFMLTSLSLAITSIHRGRSLLEQLPAKAASTAQPATATPASQTQATPATERTEEASEPGNKSPRAEPAPASPQP